MPAAVDRPQTAAPVRNSWMRQPRLSAAKNQLSAGAIITAIYVFILNSRASEILGLHRVRLAALVMLAALIAAGVAYMNGGVKLGRIGKLYLALTAIFVVSTVTSVWMGGSLDTLLNQWFRSLALFIAITCTAFTLREATAIVRAAAIGFVFLAVYTIAAGDGVAGRIGGATSVGDPNYLAMSMLYAIPLCLYFASRGNIFVRIIALGSAGIMLAVFALSGSRGGLIGFAAVVIAWFIYASMAARITLVFGTAAALTVGVVALPRPILERYTTMVVSSGAAEEGSDEVAMASGKARKYLFLRSVELTGRHPLLGVGLGMFSVAEDALSRTTYGTRKGAWHETHNMYTQVSSENGIPAAVLYIAILVITISNLNAVCRAGQRSTNPTAVQAAELARWLRLSTIGVMAAGFFLSIAYAGYIPVLAALGVLLHRNVVPEARSPRRLTPSVKPRLMTGRA